MSNPAAYAPFFPIHHLLGTSVVDGFPPEAWSTPPQSGCNHPVWILAHVVAVRRVLARNLGHAVPESDWEARAGFGEPCLEAARFPAPEALVEEYVQLGAAIGERLSSLDDATWVERFEPDFPDGGVRTLAEAVPFLISHEALHLGQLSYLRRLLGLRGIAEVAFETMKSGAPA